MPVNQSDRQFMDNALSIMKENAGLKADGLTLSDTIDVFKKFRPFLSPEPLLDFKRLSISSENGIKNQARFIYKGSSQKPLVIFFPGTAFMFPLFDENYSFFSRLMKHIDCHGLMLEYRLSPQFPYPCPHEDAESLLRYVLEKQGDLSIDPNKIIISGYSSGANMAAVLINKHQHDPNFQVFHQYLFSGGFDYTDSLHDFDAYAKEDKMLDSEHQEESFNTYCQDANRKDPLCSPYWQDDFSNVCSTTVQFGEYDGGRSQSEAYAKKLKDNHVNVKKIIMPGQIHFNMLYRGACKDGDDPAIIAAQNINGLI